MLDTVVIYGDEVCCTVVFDTLVGVFVFSVLMVENVCCTEWYGFSNECNEPTSCLVQPNGTHGVEVMDIWCVCVRGELGFLNCYPKLYQQALHKDNYRENQQNPG